MLKQQQQFIEILNKIFSLRVELQGIRNCTFKTTDLCPADEDDEDEDGGTEEEEREAGSHGD